MPMINPITAEGTTRRESAPQTEAPIHKPDSTPIVAPPIVKPVFMAEYSSFINSPSSRLLKND